MFDFEFPSFPLRIKLVTLYPLSTNEFTNLEPMNPVAPVTRIDFANSFYNFFYHLLYLYLFY